MKKKLIVSLVVGISGICLTATSQAIDLIGVFRQAIKNDPTFQAARSQWLSDKENLDISRAALIPTLDFEGSYTHAYTINNIANESQLRFKNGASIADTTITAPLFNYAAWAAVKSASASVKAATATFSAAAQDLIIRVATAYFNVLQASDILKFTEAEKKAIGSQLEQTQERYKVGLIAITDVYETKAKYESILAQEIAAKNNLVNNIEELREITGYSYAVLAGIKNTLPLITPKPKDINAWVMTAVHQNYGLLAANYTTLAAKHNITKAAAGRYPTITLDGGYDYSYQTNALDAGHNESKVTSGTATLDFPVFQGGLVSANTHQAIYNYQLASAKQEIEYRGVVAGTRQSYLGVLAGISQIKANQQSIISQESALKATEAGYLVGTRTIVDVLNAQSALYSAQKDYTQAEYEYLLDTLKLKQAAGTLNAKDLAQINAWLSKSVSLAVYQQVTQHSSFAPEHLIKYQPYPTINYQEILKTKQTKKSNKKAINLVHTNSNNTFQLPLPSYLTKTSISNSRRKTDGAQG